MRIVKFVFAVVISLFVALTFASVSLRAQTSSTSTVVGVITDSTGAVVPNAKVELTDIGTSEKSSVTTGNDGGYTFPSVRPGNYRLTVSAKGFRQAVVSGLKVEIGKSANMNLVLELGAVTETIEVVAGAAVELQTQNSSVGDVLDANMLANMPSLSRDATALVLLQPMAIAGFNGPGATGEGNASGGGVAGARMDQNTFMLDGGDATSNMEGGGGYNTGFVATPRAVVPTPSESLEEFRVQTNNAGTDFSRSIGAEVQMVTIRGTNNWHGAGYWYHQNDELNANDWFRNLRHTENPEWRDNRYGGKVGGPIWKNRTFFFVLEEERHFFTQAVFQRLVPTDTLRAGILRFTDVNTGNIDSYNLNPVATLDPSTGKMLPTSGRDSNKAACDVPTAGASVNFGPGSGTCNPLDPRMIGLSSAINAEWQTLPAANDFTGGDALNSAFFTSSMGNIVNEHDAVLRLDHKISDKWDFMGSYRYSTTAATPPNIQTDIAGIAPGCQKGVPCGISSRPTQPRFLVGGLTGRITPSLVNEFHFNWLRHWWSWIAPGARIPVIPNSESDTRLQIWSESKLNGMVPINVDTQNARQRVWNGQDYTYSDNLSWIKGKHIWNFGARAQRQNLFHIRDDKVVGGITTPIYYAVRGGFFANLGGVPVPTNVDAVADGATFKKAYISALGMIDSATEVLTRKEDFTPNAPGTNIQQREIVDSYEMYFGDTWRLKPSITVTYGLIWGVQMPPFDPNGTTTMVIDTSSGQLIRGGELFNARRQDALNGNVLNPVTGYVPIRSTGRKYPYDPDWSNFGPRLAVAWNPSFTDGLLGKFFGNKKTVVRGGWSRAFERKNGVNLVLTPALGFGYGDLSSCIAPGSGAPDPRTGLIVPATCGSGGNPNTDFRIGSNADGNHITIPLLPAVSGGVLIPGTTAVLPPATANTGFDKTDDHFDPNLKVGRSDSIDVTLQRELPGKLILEVGYVYRKGTDLFGGIDLNAVPYMFRPNSAMFGARRTNQSFAQAFDAVAGMLQGGTLPLNVNGTPNPAFKAQPALEALFGGLSSPLCSGAASAWGAGGAANQAGLVGSFASCTQAAAEYDQVNGNPYWPAHGTGALFTLEEPFLVTGPMYAANTQIGSYDFVSNSTFSNYNAGFVTLRSRAYHGLTFDANYTLAHSLDNQGLNQENGCGIPDPFFPRRSYEPSLFDRRHTFNLLVNYELPLGKGKGWATGPVTDRLLGGWSVSGIYVATSGLPDMVWDDAACLTEFGVQGGNGNDTGLIRKVSGVVDETMTNNPTITSSYGASSNTHVTLNGVKTPVKVPNAFSDPQGVVNQFRYATFSDPTLGFGAIRGPFRWNVDFNIAKKTRITERFSTRFDVQLVNAFNHPMFGLGSDSYFATQPGADISNPRPFGVPSSMFNLQRYIQMGIRFDF
jgi:hypothetical protein